MSLLAIVKNDKKITRSEELQKKCARIYFEQLITPEVAPNMTQAMINAGYARTSADTRQAELMKEGTAFTRELERLKRENFKYSDELENVRNSTLMALKNADYSKVKPRDTATVFATVDERLRLERGQATENVAISAILQDIEEDSSNKDGK